MGMKRNYQRDDSAGVVSQKSCKGDPNLLIGAEIGEKYFAYREKWDRVTNFELCTDYPLQIDFELNHSCNLRCEFCAYPYEAKTSPGQLFSFDDYKKIILAGVKIGLSAVNLNFINEPLLRNDFVDFVAFAKEAGVLDITFNTNGMLLTPELSAKLMKSGVTRVMVSIDAFTEGTYNKIRIGGDFKRVTQAVRDLVKEKGKLGAKLPIIRVSFVRTSQNEHEEKDFVDYWSDIVDYVCIQEYVKPIQSQGGALVPKKMRIAKNFRCPKPWQRVVIRYDGTVLPCCPWYGVKLPLGNIKDKSVATIWKSEKIEYLRKIHKEGHYFDEPVCKACAMNSVVETTKSTN